MNFIKNFLENEVRKAINSEFSVFTKTVTQKLTNLAVYESLLLEQADLLKK